MSVVRSWLVALVLIFSILPSVEVVESVVHLLEHGDMAHDEHDGGIALGSSEHGCSGSFHMCGHTANMIPTSGHLVVQPHDVPPTAATLFSLHSSRGRGAMAPPIRPPIA